MVGFPGGSDGKESESHSVLSNSLRPLYSPWNSPGQNTGVGSLSLLQGIFPTQGLNPGLLPYRWVLYQLSHQRICLQCGRLGFNPWVRNIPWRKKWQPTPVFSPGESHGQRNLAGYSPWGCKRVRHNLVTKKKKTPKVNHHLCLQQVIIFFLMEGLASTLVFAY